MAALDTFQTDATRTFLVSNEKPEQPEARSIVFSKPNKFKIVTGVTTTEGDRLCTVCDGTRLVEYNTEPGSTGAAYPAPKSIGAAASMVMSNPMLHGSPFYQFFGGSANFAGLVDSDRSPVTFGPEEKLAAEPGRVVKFFGAQSYYGREEALIGEKTGLVYRLSWDLSPMRGTLHLPDDVKLLVTETYSNLRSNEKLGATTFDTTAPKGIPIQESSESPAFAAGESPPPVPLGSPAPDIELTGLDGKKVKLSSQKGKIVMIDFWATWCVPCREGLPVTNKLHEKFASKGLQVFAVSNEDRETVADFVKAKRFTFPALRDADGSAAKAYKIEAIPTLVIIDAKGNLVSYAVGLEPEDTVIANLKKAGLKID